MKTKAICPACKFQIPLWRIMIAPTPYAIKCPICLSTIRVRLLYVFGIALSGLLASLLVIGGVLLLVHDLFQAGMIILGILLILWLAFELLFGLLVCNTPTVLEPHKLGNEIRPEFLSKGK